MAYTVKNCRLTLYSEHPMAIFRIYAQLSNPGKRRLERIARDLIKPIAHSWRRGDHNLENIIRHDVSLKTALVLTQISLIKNGHSVTLEDLYRMTISEVRETLDKFQQISQQKTIPNDSESLKRELQVNPLLSLLFLESINSQAAIVEAENLENAQNNMMENLIESETVSTAIEQAEMDSTFDPYTALGVSPDVAQPEIQSQCLEALSEKASVEGTSSHAFITAALATALIGTHERRAAHKEDLEKSTDNQESISSIPRPIPPIWT